MRPWVKGVIIAVVQVAIVSSLGAKLLIDRATQPRVWALTAPYDPDLPIRGRYVRMQIVVEPLGLGEIAAPQARQSHPVILRVENRRLVAEVVRQDPTKRADLYIRHLDRQGQTLAVLDTTVAFFIPEHVPDPSRLQQGEELWVEVTVPKKGPPRPIHLGLRKGNGPIVPLDL